MGVVKRDVVNRDATSKPAVFAGMVEFIGNAEKIDFVESILSHVKTEMRVPVC